MIQEYKIVITQNFASGSLPRLDVKRVDHYTDSVQVETLANERCLSMQDAINRIVEVLCQEDICSAVLPQRELAGLLRSMDLA